MKLLTLKITIPGSASEARAKKPYWPNVHIAVRQSYFGLIYYLYAILRNVTFGQNIAWSIISIFFKTSFFSRLFFLNHYRLESEKILL